VALSAGVGSCCAGEVLGAVTVMVSPISLDAELLVLTRGARDSAAGVALLVVAEATDARKLRRLWRRGMLVIQRVKWYTGKETQRV
jgi:hypothetical protein